MQSSLSTISVSSLKGVGPKVAEKLAKLGIHHLEDLLFHLPLRYQDRSRIYPIETLTNGQTAQVCGVIEKASIVFGKRRSLVCTIADDTGVLDIRLFYFSMAQKKQFVTGEYLQCFGQVNQSGRNLGMVHPELTFLKDNPTPKLEQGLKAIYPTTEGLQQRKLQAIIEQALQYLSRNDIIDLLPKNYLEKLNFPPIKQAVLTLHKPPIEMSLSSLEQGDNPLLQRLAFEELIAQHIALLHAKKLNQAHRAIAINSDKALITRFLARLPFQLTSAQSRVIAEIQADLHQNFPMMRLVQGDVGAGKTLVAACCMLDVASANLQSVLMAPTEILAEQHYQSFSDWFEPLGMDVVLLKSKMPSAEKKSVIENIASGKAQIIIGTHALFQEQVVYAGIGIVVIDEQHRFGVEQRKTLLEKGFAANNQAYQPHQLIMTATPIPRTLAQTAFADLDLSVIDELPPGRKPIQTVAISDEKRDQVIARVSNVCQQEKRQVYWVCTLIEESEELQCQAAEVTHQQLSEQLSPLSVGLVHGRMKPNEKQRVMQQFKRGEIDVLVATTVIEVGVDVPNASLMIIENPERLGLSQLHQLRGRVGRGDIASHCLLMYHPPLSNTAKARLAVMRESNDGFVIAEKDLSLRGPGEMLGTRQTGALEYRFADLVRDSHLLPEVYWCADDLLSNDQKRAQALVNRWVKSKIQLSRV